MHFVDLSLRSPDYTNDDMKRKTKHLIDEFLLGIDFEEAIKCVSEMTSPNNVHMFMNFAISQVLERSSQAKYYVGHLLYTLLKKEIITFEQYKNGFTKIIRIIEKNSSSNSLIWDHMSIILQPIIEDSKFPLIKDVLYICISSETAGKLVSAILHRAAKIKELEFTISPSKIRLKAQMSFAETKKHLWGSFDTVEASEEFDVLASIILNSFFSVRSKFS
ncbi:UNVERIFIED_CONTAM: Eif4g3 [Trichonephila clavipes]